MFIWMFNNFCPHHSRDFSSLSKENVYENNRLVSNLTAVCFQAHALSWVWLQFTCVSVWREGCTCQSIQWIRQILDLSPCKEDLKCKNAEFALCYKYIKTKSLSSYFPRCAFPQHFSTVSLLIFSLSQALAARCHWLHYFYPAAFRKIEAVDSSTIDKQITWVFINKWNTSQYP